MSDATLPMFDRAIDRLPPDVLRRRVRADEQLYWWSRGRGGRHLYGLTNQRLLYSGGLLSVSLGRDGGSGGAIHMLDVFGDRERGDIQLQARFVPHSLWVRFGLRLHGIERPLEVAQLIQTTLKLDTSIEDHTR